MNIQVNGTAHVVPQNSTLAVLLEQLRLAGKRVAVELNGEIVPRSTYSATPLHEDDCLEIMQAIGGG